MNLNGFGEACLSIIQGSTGALVRNNAAKPSFAEGKSFFPFYLLIAGALLCSTSSVPLLGVLKEATNCELKQIPHVLLFMVHTKGKCSKLSYL